ncbi:MULTISPECIES: EamA family transporter RarD [Desulfosediminicola]|uniref:EamA family transporter RarD n=1 Tax=Desulfosediminicola TaxID=2886823 RepID=UPI0010AC25E0|nr:EamA family transporter RarD [Desulfosediminicola ganghwensis]
MNTQLGVFSAIAAYVLWGVLPVYWKLLQQVPAHEILCHRMSWSLLFTIGLIFLLKRSRSLLENLRDKESVKISIMAAVLLGGNWLLYIWAVNAGHVIEASLGYFTNPLISVLFGVIFLKENMRRAQAGALLIAAVGVLYLTIYYGKFPWIALSLACSFALYGLLHKKSSTPALEGLCMETMVLFVPATMLLLFWESNSTGSFGHIGLSGSLLLFGTGVITSLPLLLFGYAAQNISLTHLGLLQYIAPSISLVLGIFVYHEPFPISRMIGFVLIWSALALYMMESIMLSRRQKRAMTIQS